MDKIFQSDRILLTPLLLGAIILASFAGGASLANRSLGAQKQQFSLLPQNDASAASVPITNDEQAVINVVKTASPAVVSIIASAQVPQVQQCTDTPTDIPPQFQQFFPPGQCQQQGTTTVLQDVSAGTGFIVSADGYILTNKHVVADKQAQYTVVLNDDANLGQKVMAKLISTDPSNDIAVLKINMKNLPFLKFGDSTSLQVGQTAIAIGYSLGEFDNTVSKGVVSGLSRSIEAGGASGAGGAGVETLRGLIQTDAAINPGNSGGPLLDLSGNVIGMNVAVAQAQGISFAIPSNAVQLDFGQVQSSGKITGVERAFLGVRYQPITTELQSTNKLTYNYGMLVSSDNGQPAVVSGSPADKAGLKENDIILEMDGKQLNERFLLSDAIDQHKPGDTVTIKISHNGTEKTIQVQLSKST